MAASYLVMIDSPAAPERFVCDNVNNHVWWTKSFWGAQRYHTQEEAEAVRILACQQMAKLDPDIDVSALKILKIEEM